MVSAGKVPCSTPTYMVYAVLALASVIAYTLLALALLSANVYLLGVVGCPCQLSTPR